MSFFAELKRRNVVKVGIAYVVASWLLLQLTEVLTELLEIGPDVGKIVILLLIIGFIPALIFAWAFELTPEGIKRDHEVDRTQSIANQTGRKLDFAVIGMLVVIAGYFIWESRFKEDAPAEVAAEASAEMAPAASAEPEVPAIDPNSIAVLPFANRSNQDDDLFFSDGIHDDLLTQLAKIDDLKVISRTSVMEYRDTTKKIPTIAGELGVSKILEGGVQRAGDRVRINAQLIDVETDEHLWAETFDREMTIDNLFDIQSEITRQIVTAVKGELTDEEARNIAERPTDSLPAWEAYLHSRSIISEPEYSASKYQRAEPWLQQAVLADPDFAVAWAELAEVQMQGIWIGYANTDEQRVLVRESLDNAVRLAPDHPRVMGAQAEYHYRIENDYQASLDIYNDAILKAPGDSELFHYTAVTLRRLGRWEDSIRNFERTLELDPLNVFAATTMIETLQMMNLWERSEKEVEFWRLRHPESPALIRYKVEAMVRGRGDLEGARRFLDTIEPTGPVFKPGLLTVARLGRDWDTFLAVTQDQQLDQRRLEIFNVDMDFRTGIAHALSGSPETARTYLERHIANSRDRDIEGVIGDAYRHRTIAVSEAWLGNTEAALEHMAQAKQLLPLERDHLFGANIDATDVWLTALSGQRDAALERIAAKLNRPEGFSSWELYLDPGWDFFRDDPRFTELVRPEGVEPEPFRNQRLGDGT